MARILAVSLILLAPWVLAGSAWGQAPLPLAYATDPAAPTRCTLPFDPSIDPIPPPVVIPVGGPPVTLDLCFLNWTLSPSGTGTPCLDGTGPKTCAVKFVYQTNGGITIQSATAAEAPAEEDFPDYEVMFDATSLSVMGGNPIDGDNGDDSNVGFRVATVTLQGVSPLAWFKLVTGPSTRVDEMLASVAVPDTLLAATVDLCGNSVDDAGEECDDGNSVGGDGCSDACRIEDDFTLIGQAGPSAQVVFQIVYELSGGGGLTSDVVYIPLLPNVVADEAAAQVVASINLDSILGANGVSALQALASDQPPGTGPSSVGRRVSTNADFEVPFVIDPDPTSTLQVVPEPGTLLGLISSLAFLAVIGRHRIKP